MMRPLLLFFILCLSILAAGNVSAGPATEAERVALDQLLGRYEGAVDRRDMAAVVNMMPPRVFTHMSAQSGMSVDQLKAMVVKLSGGVMDMIGESKFDHDAVVFKELSDGSRYALVPTTTIVKLKDGPTYRAKSHTLAVLEDGNWYLMRVNEPKQLIILHGAYPAFSNVELPQGSMELLED